MLLTINNQPYIKLDSYLNIDRLLELKDDFYFMSTYLWQKSRYGVWHTGGQDIDNPNSIFREQESLYWAKQLVTEDRKTNTELDRKIKIFEDSGDMRGLAKYLKLKYKLFDPYEILQIRYTKSEKNLYAADGATFTKEDWESYRWIEEMNQFQHLVDFIKSLPFEYLGMVTFFINEHYVPLGYHRDYNYNADIIGNQPNTFPHRQEIIWFRFDLDRPFYLYDIEDNQVLTEIPVEGYSAFYNHHQWHGNLNGSPNSSLTMKVEGVFTDDFRKTIGIDHIDRYYYEN